MSRFTKNAQLPYGYSVDMHWGEPSGLTLKWTPSPPPKHMCDGQGKFIKAYRKARDQFITTVATSTGQVITLVELDGKITHISPQTKQ